MSTWRFDCATTSPPTRTPQTVNALLGAVVRAGRQETLSLPAIISLFYFFFSQRVIVFFFSDSLEKSFQRHLRVFQPRPCCALSAFQNHSNSVKFFFFFFWQNRSQVVVSAFLPCLTTLQCNLLVVQTHSLWFVFSNHECFVSSSQTKVD